MTIKSKPDGEKILRLKVVDIRANDIGEYISPIVKFRSKLRIEKIGRNRIQTTFISFSHVSLN